MKRCRPWGGGGGNGSECGSEWEKGIRKAEEVVDEIRRMDRLSSSYLERTCTKDFCVCTYMACDLTSLLVLTS